MSGRIVTSFCYRLWRLLNRGAERRFKKAQKNVEQVQTVRLMSLLQRNAGTEFGRQHGFGQMRCVADFQDSVPLSEYPDLAEAVRGIAQGEQNCLTREPVLCLEPTSGSSLTTKLIPCTTSYLREFRNGIAVWMNNLFSIYPQITVGTTFWSLTPKAEASVAGVRLPVGFPDDMVYAAGIYAPLVRKLSAVPAEVAEIVDTESYYYVALLFLLQRRDLTWISVWNPGMWLLFWGRLQNYWPQLVKALGCGTLAPPQALEPSLHRTLARRLRADPRRAEEVARAFQENPAQSWRVIWPKLALISCWGDAWAREEFAKLRQSFPGVALQKKGLLATEALVTIPMGLDNRQMLGVTSHFYEFISQTDGAVMLAHQLRPGERYEVVVTTGGGLYRYRLRDVVEVVGFEHDCPLLEFVGRNDKVADFFGEKLHAGHVENALTEILAQNRIKVRFRLLACETMSAPPGYVLYLESAELDDATLLAIGRKLEVALQDNYHYRHCREMGQLGELQVFRVAAEGRKTFLERCCRQGQRLGDVKSECLQLSPNWSMVFTGHYLSGRRLMEA